MVIVMVVNVIALMIFLMTCQSVIMVVILEFIFFGHLKVSRVEAEPHPLSLHLGNKMILDSIFFFISVNLDGAAMITMIIDQIAHHNPVFILLGIRDECVKGKGTFSVHFLAKQVVSGWKKHQSRWYLSGKSIKLVSGWKKHHKI